jgi:sec-independent protein translocase protein TatC
VMFFRREPMTDEKRMELVEHLGELRTRLMRSIWYLILGATITYQFFTPLYNVLYKPLSREMNAQNAMKARQNVANSPDVFIMPPEPKGEVITRDEYQALVRAIVWVRDHPGQGNQVTMAFKNFWEPFMLRLKLSIIFGFILTSPFIFWEISQFIAPALTPEEKRPLRLLMPVSALMMAAGVCLAYYTMFYAMQWFLSYMNDFPPPNSLLQNPQDYVLFFVKMMAVFGLVFQLPVILAGGAFLGVISAKGIMKGWRYGVLLAALSGLFIPSSDFVSMAAIAIAVLILYFGSFFLVRGIEISKARRLARAAKP